MTVLAVNLGFLIGGAVIVEKVFDVPGLGQGENVVSTENVGFPSQNLN